MAHLPSLNSLRAFEAVSRLGSVSLAAAELSVTAGAVSRHIKELELDLGTAVLQREGRGVRVTSDGDKLKKSLNPAFAMIHTGVQRLRRDPRQARLIVRMPPVFAECWLMPRLERFRRSAPKVDITIADSFNEGTSPEEDILIEWGVFDGTSGMKAQRLTDEQIFPVCVPGMCPNLTLAGAPLIHRHNFPSPYEFPDWLTFVTAVGLEAVELLNLKVGIRVSAGLVMDAVRSGMGVALVNTTVAHDDLASGRLVRPIAHAMDTQVGYWLLIPEAAQDRPEVKAFHAWIINDISTSIRGEIDTSAPDPTTRG